MRQVDCCVWVIYLFLFHFTLRLWMFLSILRFTIVLFGVTLWHRRGVCSALVKVSNALITIILGHGFHIFWCFLTLRFFFVTAAVPSFCGAQVRKTQLTLQVPEAARAACQPRTQNPRHTHRT